MVTLTVHQTYTAQSLSDNTSDHTSLLSDKHAIWPDKCPMTECYNCLWYAHNIHHHTNKLKLHTYNLKCLHICSSLQSYCFCAESVYTPLSPSEEEIVDPRTRDNAAIENTDKNLYLYLLAPSPVDLKRVQALYDNKVVKSAGTRCLPNARRSQSPNT